MKPSKFDGQRVVYVDKLRLEHTGVIVGQSDDGEWFYVQSDHRDIEAREWHFKVSREVLPGVLER